MVSRELSIQMCTRQIDIERAHTFVDSLQLRDERARKSPTVQRYSGLLGSLVKLRRAYEHGGFRPSLIIDRENERVCGVGSIALRQTIFHPAEGVAMGTEIDYVVQSDITSDEHRFLADKFTQQQQQINAETHQTNGHRKYPVFGFLVDTNPYQPLGIELSSDFYCVGGAGHISIDQDVSNVAKGSAILSMYHSK